WMFVNQMSAMTEGGLSGRLKRAKFFSTRSPTPDFAAASIDWIHRQITLLGEHLPIQTVELLPETEKKSSFEFHTASGGLGYGEVMNNELKLQDAANQLTLYSASPRDLMQNVADVYQSANEHRAFRPNPKQN